MNPKLLVVLASVWAAAARALLISREADRSDPLVSAELITMSVLAFWFWYSDLNILF